MNRRDVLKYTSLTFGYVATAGAMSALISGCKVEPKLNFVPKALSESQVQTLTSVVDIIFPKTATPAASEVGVVEFIDSMLGEVANAEEKEEFQAGMTLFNAEVEKRTEQKFNDLDTSAQTEIVTAIDKAAFADGEDISKELAGFWRSIKGNTYQGYFNSEVIGETVLAYLPLPGDYQGCVDLSVSDGKAWSLTW